MTNGADSGSLPQAATEDSPLSVLQGVLRASLEGDLRTVYRRMTDDGTLDAVRIANALPDELATASGFDVEPLESSQELHRFKVTIRTESRDIESSVTLQRIDDRWFVTAIKVPEVREWAKQIICDTAEDTLRAAFEAALVGNLIPVVESLTSAAYVDVLRIVAWLGEVSPAQSYEIWPETVNGDRHVYRIKVQIADREIVGRATLMRKNGTWCISAIKVPGVRD